MVLKMTERDKTPILYTHYGKQYQFDDLQRSADMGFDDFVSSIKRGDKDYDKFREAYNNIMAGIKNGTITFENGRYRVSKGGYTNSDKKNRDYYGIMANYIYGLQGKSKEYTKPEDTSDTRIKWKGNTSMAQSFNRSLYGSDRGDVRNFWDLDSYNEETKSRPITGRLSRINQFLKDRYDNFDSYFTGYSNEDKNQTLTDIQSAMSAIQDGKIDAGDYLALNKVFGNLDFRNLLTTQQGQASDEEPSQVVETPERQGFLQWVAQKYPQFSGTLMSPISLQYSTSRSKNTIDRVAQALMNQSPETLQKSLYAALMDDAYDFYREKYIRDTFTHENPNIGRQEAIRFLLSALKSQNKTSQFSNNPDLYYIQDIDTSNQTGFVWDNKNNTISEMSYHDIPYWRDKIYQEWLSEQGVIDPSNYYTTRYSGYRYKNGGIIKAQDGVKVDNTKTSWYNDVFTPLLNHILEGLSKNENYYGWINDMQDRHSEIYKAAGNDFTNKSYNNPLVGTYQDLYKSGFNNEWNGSPLGYNTLGIDNAYKSGRYIMSRVRTSGDAQGKYTTDNLFSGITDDRRLLGRVGDFTDEQLKQVTTAFRNKGYDFVADNNGYYKLNPLSQQVIQTQPGGPAQPEWSESDKEVFRYIKDNPTKETEVKLTNPEIKSQFNFRTILSEIAPEALRLGRLFDSLHTNNKVAKVIRESLNPVLKDTYELYSPITGAFSEMQFRNRQASNVRRVASRPITSDASLALAGALDANRQATDLEYQGFLVNDKEIKRTAAEALKRQEDNTARRSAVSNENRASINRTNREIAELEATRLRRNWQSRDSYLQGIESRSEQNRERINNFRLQTSLFDIDKQYQDAVTKANKELATLKRNNPGVSVTSLPEYQNYQNFMREMANWKAAQTYKAHAGVYGYSYYNKDLNQSPTSIAAKYGYFKNGGQLRPSILHLINKIIKDENNT